MKSGIYIIENTTNGHIYVGSAVNLTKRKINHFYALRNGTHSNKHLQKAWIKYRENSFIFKIILECQPLELISNEQRFIDELKPQYNIQPTAYSNLGVIFSEETRRKNSISHKGKTNPHGPLSLETRQKISQSKKGKPNPHSKEHGEKLSLAQIGRKTSDETRAKQSLAKKGKKKSTPSKLIGRTLSEEHKRKISDKLAGREISSETRDKIRENMKIIWEDRRRTGYKLSAEAREKISIAQTERRRKEKQNRTGD